MPSELVMLSNHLNLCHPLLLPSIFPRVRVFFNENPQSGWKASSSHLFLHSLMAQALESLCGNWMLLLLLLLSCFSRVRFCVTPQTAAPQTPLSLGFSRQEQWSGVPFPSPMHESENWKWKLKVKSLSRIRLPATPWTAAHQAPPSMGFSRLEYWSGLPLPSPLKCSTSMLNDLVIPGQNAGCTNWPVFLYISISITELPWSNDCLIQWLPWFSDSLGPFYCLVKYLRSLAIRLEPSFARISPYYSPLQTLLSCRLFSPFNFIPLTPTPFFPHIFSFYKPFEFYFCSHLSSCQSL